jgi:hypothetical protein
VAAEREFSWPSDGKFVTAYGEDLMAVVSEHNRC